MSVKAKMQEILSLQSVSVSEDSSMEGERCERKEVSEQDEDIRMSLERQNLFARGKDDNLEQPAG